MQAAAMGRPRWLHDVEAVVCAECHVPFGTLRRKHHCRQEGACLHV